MSPKGDKAPPKIGRGTSCDAVLDGAAVSRAHRRLEPAGDEVARTDPRPTDRSTDGTAEDRHELFVDDLSASLG